MQSEGRAILAFTGLGVVFVVVALLASRLETGKGGVSALPDAPAPGTLAASEHGAAPHPHLPVPHREGSAAAAPLRLMQSPSLSATDVAFAFAGEIWTVPREGGEALRLVTGQLRNRRPIFSPDGKWLAYTGVYDGNADVYVVPSTGGEPRRLTYYPGTDEAVGWTPDGTKVLVSSTRATTRDLPKLFTVPLTGGAAEQLPLPSGTDASFSPDGKRIAYIPFFQYQPGWRLYRGGQTTPVWLADLADSRITKIPRENTNDRMPTWVGDTVYFLSDRNGPYTLFAYDVGKGAVREVIHNPDGFDLRSASASADGRSIVYEQLGEIHVYDLATRASRLVPVTISADLPQVRPRFVSVEPEHVLSVALSPSGKRVLFEARGEILSVPAEKGTARNLTQSPAAADRNPAWSPDGKWVAWLSDESGEYALYIRSPDGLGTRKVVALGDPPSFFYNPTWSPDSKKILLTDKRENLWLVDLDKVDASGAGKALIKVDTNHAHGGNFDASWSPDSHFIVYRKDLANRLDAIAVYSLEDKSVHELTDGRSDPVSPRFDRSGNFVWFIARTDVGPAHTSGMTAMARPVTGNVYAIVLRKGERSPVALESDEEGDVGPPGTKPGKGDKSDKSDKDKTEGKGDQGDKDKDSGDDKKDKSDAVVPKKVPPVKIDFEGIDQRIVALPIDRANYVALEPAEAGNFFLLAAPVVTTDEDYVDRDPENPRLLEVLRFEKKTRKTEPFLEKLPDQAGAGCWTFYVSANGKKVLYAKDNKWFIAGSDKAPKAGDGEVKLRDVKVYVDPRAEWRQIYREVWRIERDFLYDPAFHGVDLAAAEKLYAPFLDGIAAREDLSALITEMLSYLVLGHVRTRGGALPHQESVSVGLLGADYAVDDGHYRFSRILRGENYNPKLRAPLTEPGVDVKEGDYLLAVNGQEVKATEPVERAFLATAGKQTTLTVGATADGHRSRLVTVVPIPSETNLRLRTWMEDNKKKVDELSGGRVAYVYVPDTAGAGLTNFDRYYFSQADKDAVIIDERFNHGGQIADYIVNILSWKPLMGNTSRDVADQVIPAGAIFGPKVMLANELSGSGGDALPWMYKKAALGPLVGTRTWGGLVGIGGYPPLVDGALVTAPHWALYGTHGEWEVENHGIAPDVEVEQDPALVRQGHDPQLERGVALALEALAKNPPTKLKRPAYPSYGGFLPKRSAGSPSP